MCLFYVLNLKVLLCRMPIIDKFKDMGTVVMGKVESGSVREGDSLLVMPNKVQVKVFAVYCDENKVKLAGPGENVRVRLSGIEEEDIISGFVLSSIGMFSSLNLYIVLPPMTSVGENGNVCEPVLLEIGKKYIEKVCQTTAPNDCSQAVYNNELSDQIKSKVHTAFPEVFAMMNSYVTTCKTIHTSRIGSSFHLAKPIPAVYEFVAQLQILELLDNAIFTAGYKAVLHIHSIVEECEIIELLQQIDPKTKKPMKKKVLFVKNGAVVVCRIQVNNLICIEKFSDFPQLGRFTLRTEGKTVAMGKVMDLNSASSI
ncbi:Eukaryotic peptide chain release factor GTP-binding subunit [Vitis vinifera]|uniref:Eukaryotic peptide chain release factor GTP-binding subunit n=1 Tax=Vitis vinifera TaxID=29760 RepID=A0A438KAD1_VITVI|nr:Eukaryotic peptide chain release factor GTP-binding subunit [Vitis vinifera]